MPRAKTEQDATDVQCKNYFLKDGADEAKRKGRRCTNPATHYLLNGSQVQSQVCEGCGSVIIKANEFLTMKPLDD